MIRRLQRPWMGIPALGYGAAAVAWLGTSMVLAPALSAQALPPKVEALQPRAVEAEADWKRARSACDALEAEILPQAEALRAQRVEQPGGEASWWRAFLLRRRLARLQSKLDELRLRRSRLSEARGEFFAVLSALQEELRAAMERELASPQPNRLALRGWLEAKEAWDRKLEEIGVYEERPFQLADDPGRARSGLQAADRRARLEARQIQLEAWREMLRRDLRLFRRLQAQGLASPGRLAELEGLRERIERLLRENQQALSKN